MKSRRLVIVLLLTLVFPLAAFAIGPEDPYFKQWARFKVGSSVNMNGTADDKDGHSSFTQTMTLKEIRDDHLIIEIVRTENGKTITKSKKVDKIGDKSDIVVDGGKDEITLAGKKYKCRQYTLKVFDKDGKEQIAFSYWFHPDIPGAARIVAESSYGGDRAKATQSAVSWIKK